MSSAGFIVGNIGAWVKLTLNFEDFSDPSFSFTRTLTELLGRHILKGLIVHPTAAFGGGGIATYLLSIGVLGDETLFVQDLSLTPVPSGTAFAYSDISYLASMTDDTDIKVRAVSTGANLDQATAGAVDIYVLTGSVPN